MSESISGKIRAGLALAGLPPVADVAIDQLANYLSLILRWNARINLTSIRDEDGIISRHIIEAIEVSNHLPKEVFTLLDFGSGAGLPGIPIAVCRPEIEVTLAESQNKKAAFLMEAVRVLGLSTKVHSGRAEDLESQFDCVALRAVDKMAEAVSSAVNLIAPGGWLALIATQGGLSDLKSAAGPEITWASETLLSGSKERVLALGRKISGTEDQ